MSDDHAQHDHPVHDFDERAATWDDDPGKAERARQVAGEIRAALALDGSMRVLEFGAGTGLLTQALQDEVGPVTLTDTSAGMRQVMQDKIDAGAIADGRVWDVDLATGPLPDERFDLVVSLMALHHIPDTDAVLANVATLLDEGGHVAIVDLDAEDGSFHGQDAPVHKGFDRAELAAQLAAAGLTDIDVRDCYEMERESGRSYPLFLAVAAKPTS